MTEQQLRELEVRLLNAKRLEDPEEDLTNLADPNVGNPDAEPGGDTPDQRPITDNKAGG